MMKKMMMTRRMKSTIWILMASRKKLKMLEAMSKKMRRTKT